jgi:hypothetical protein
MAAATGNGPPERRPAGDEPRPAMPAVKVGQEAPDFTLQGIGGKEWRLGQARGRHHVVLLFYVLDWTPG